MSEGMSDEMLNQLYQQDMAPHMTPEQTLQQEALDHLRQQQQEQGPAEGEQSQMTPEMQQQFIQQMQQLQQMQLLVGMGEQRQLQQLQQMQQMQMQQRESTSGEKGQNMNPLTGAPYTPRFYYLLEKRQKLPAWAARQDFLRLLQSNQVVVLVGEPGCGKSTQLPQILLDAGYHVVGGQVKAIACVQPHQLAAVSAAQRVCDELEVQPGTFVGHVTRFEDKTSTDTLLRFLTDEALFREAMQDPLLERYSVIMIDEVQQRTLDTDVLLGVLKMVMQRRPDLKVVLLASSMDVQTVQGYFEGAPLITLPNRTHQVDVLYAKDSEKDYVKAAVRTVCQIHTSEPEGDVLIFLATEDDIDSVCQALRKEAATLMTCGAMVVCPLYVGLPLAEHQKVFEAAPAAKLLGGTGGKPGRKIIVATSVAESSIAIDGIAFVIDLGLSKQRVYNPRTRVECMMVSPISRSSASARASMAGRTRPGKCFRIYTEKAFNNELPDQLHPELMRSNLSTVILMLKMLGFDDVVHFDFVDAPSPEALMRAIEVLNYLGCLDDNGNITEVGQMACRLPTDPQMAKMLIDAPRHRCSNEALSIASMLCVLPVFLRPNDAFRAANEAKARFAHMDGDHLTLLNIFHAYKQMLQDGQDPAKFCAENFISLRALRAAEVAREHLKKAMESIGLQMVSTDFQDKEYYPNIRRCLVSGFFMQAACSENEKKGGYVTLREGQEVMLHPSTSLAHKPEWMVYHDLVLSSKTFIRTATQVRPEWLLEASPGYFDTARMPEKNAVREKLEKIKSKMKQGS